MGYSSWFVKGIQHARKKTFFVLSVVMHQTLSHPAITGRVGITNVTDMRRQRSSSRLHEATALAVVVLPRMCCCRSQPRYIQ